MTSDGGRPRAKFRSPKGFAIVSASICALIALGYTGSAVFLRTASTTSVTEPPSVPTTSTTSLAVGSADAPPSDDAALPKCNERLAGYQATSVDDVVLERAYLSNASTVFHYQRSIHTDEYDTPLDDEPRNERVFVCWFSSTGYTFSPRIGDEPPEVDQVVDAITDSGDVVPLLRGKQSEATPVRPA